MARLIKSEKEVEGRYEEVWTLVEEDALDQWPAGPGDVVGRPAARLDGYEKARGVARYTGDLQLPGTLHTALLRSPFARCRVKRIDLAAAAAAPGVLGVIGPDEVQGVDSEAHYEGSAVGAVAAETFAQAEAAVRLIDVEWEELEPLLDADEAVRQGSLARGNAPLRARRLRGAGSPRPTPSSRPSTARRRSTTTRSRRISASASGAATRSTSTSRRSASGASATTSRRGARAAARQGARRLRVHGRRLRREGRPRQHHPARGRARDSGPGARCAARSRAATRTSSAATATRRVQRVTRRRPRRRHAHRARRRVHLRARRGTAGCRRRPGPMQLLYACDNVRTVEHGAKLNLPPMAAFRAPGFVEGTWSLECLLDKLAAQLGIDPLELRKRNYAHVDTMDGRPFSSKAADGVLPARRAALGAPARGARALGRDLEARDGHGQPDLVRRRRPAELRVGAARLRRARERRHGDAGHRHRHARRRWRRSPPRSSASRSTASRSSSATPPAARTPRVSGGSSTLPSMGPAVRSAAADAARQVLELAAQRFECEERTAVAARAAGSSPRTVARGRWRSHRPARRRPDPRQGRARAEPGRHARPHVRHPARRGRGRRRDGRGRRREDRRDPRRRPRDQPARRAQPGRGRDHPGARPHVLRGAARRPADRHGADARRSTRTSCRRSPTCPRSSASSSTSPTRT